jgi:colanic acid biosynthesis protein WcaH
MKLSADEFAQVVAKTVLVSIDLILHDQKNRVLLGRRLNAPAKGFWFVPGGSVKKRESLRQALARIARGELGIELPEGSVELLGVYDHFYGDSFFDPQVPTHYVVLACRCRLPENVALEPDHQHDELRYFSIDELLAAPEVHDYTKNYFRSEADNLFLRGAMAQ